MSTRPAPEILVNGRDAATVDVRDRGLHYGDGVFETLRCDQGHVRWWSRHLRRLAEGCRRLGIVMPNVAQLEGELARLATSRDRALLKVVLTRGPMTRRSYRPAGNEVPTRVVSVHDWPADDGAPLSLGFCGVRLGHNPMLAGIKHLNRLENVLAQQEAQRQGIDEVVLLGTQGEVVCGSMSNLIAVTQEGLVTPALEGAGISGVMRSLALDAAAALGIALDVASLSPGQLRAASAIYCSNVRLGLRQVGKFEGRVLATDARVERLMAWIDAQA